MTTAESAITVRRVKFELPDDPDVLDDVFPGDDIVDETYLVAFSLTLPYVEPYLIRTYRAVADQITDPRLAADTAAFCGQEAQHFQNHRRLNEQIKQRLEPGVVAELEAIEADLERDFRRFSNDRSDRFNLVYSEGFEAATCAWSMAMFERAAAGSGPSRFGPWQQLWAWHAAEEIEHRAVAFAVYEHLVGSYWYRVIGSIRCQWHYQRYIDRFQKVLLASQGEKPRRKAPAWWRVARRRYLRTYLPGYDPATLRPEPLVDVVLAQYTPPAA